MHLSVGVLPRVGLTSFHRTTTATCLLTSGQNKDLKIARNRTESLDATRRRYISSSGEEHELLTARKKVLLPYGVISRTPFEMPKLKTCRRMSSHTTPLRKTLQYSTSILVIQLCRVTSHQCDPQACIFIITQSIKSNLTQNFIATQSIKSRRE